MSMTQRAPLAFVAVGALSLVACSGQDDPSCDSQQIVNGTLNSADPAVVALTVQGSQFCTGTLVSPRVVVTAAHCLPPNVEFPADAIEVAFGTSTAAPDTLIPAVEALAHPSWSLSALPNDIGVLRLTQDAPVTPIPMARTALTSSDVGQEMRMVGFGVTGAEESDNGFKRHGFSTIVAVDEFSIYYDNQPSGTCFGDSGGPAFFEVGGSPVFAGIHSRSDCQVESLDERVDIHVDDFIEPFISGIAPANCEMDGQCAGGCSRPDPDCLCAGDGFCSSFCTDAVADPDCDDRCAADGECIETGCPAPDPDCSDSCL